VEGRSAASTPDAPSSTLAEGARSLKSLVSRARGLPLSGVVLVTVIALEPLWTVSHVRGRGTVFVEPFGLITLGRVLFAIVGLALVVDLIRSREFRLSRFVLLFVALMVTLEGWVAINGSVWGCLSCEGSFGGLSDMVVAALLALAVLILHPPMGGPVLLAIAFACVFGALLAVAGAGDLVSGEPAVSWDGRLAGPYGNANFLAFAIAPGIPVLLALSTGRAIRIRLAALALCAFLAVTLVLTYSRGGLIATGVAAAAVIILQVPAQRRLVLATVLIVVLGAGGALAFAALKDRRLESQPTTPPPAELLRAIDHSGWDGTAQGLVPAGPSQLANRARKTVLNVKPASPRSGVSYPWGVGRSHTSYRLRLQMRTPAPSVLHVGFEDNFEANAPVSRPAPTGPHWRTVELTWNPSARSPDARFYVWRPHGHDPFELRKVSIVAIGPNGRSSTKRISTALLGSNYPREQRRLRLLAGSDERYYVQSRWKGARLAVTAFLDQPLRGIGWEKFPELSYRRLPFGHLPTHNEYLRFAAELGIVGFLLVMGIGGTALVALGSIPRGRVRLALVGAFIAGGLSILFVNGLVAPAAGGWLVIACAVAVASSRYARARS
jgi:O-Antigen ligase